MFTEILFTGILFTEILLIEMLFTEVLLIELQFTKLFTEILPTTDAVHHSLMIIRQPKMLGC